MGPGGQEHGAARMLPHTVTMPPEDARLLGLPESLSVSRVWPRRPDRLTLELIGADGSRLAGQWFADPADRDRITAGTRGRAARPEHAPLSPSLDADGGDAGPVLVQAHGADRRLRALPGALAGGNATLMVHRPERRAVVHRAAPDGRDGQFLRIVRPGRAAPLVRAAADAEATLAGHPSFRTAAVRSADDDGVLVTDPLPGDSLRELGSHDESAARTGAAGLGMLLRHLGGAERASHLPLRDQAAELEWVGTWLQRVADHLPHLHPRLAPHLGVVAHHLDQTVAAPPGVVHGDLHDDQVLVADDGTLGVLDWDTVAVGEVPLDAANIWAHADLRRLLGQCPAEHAAAVWTTVVDTWQPDARELARTAAYRRLILLRLACQYAFRPHQRHITPELVSLAVR